MCSFSQNLQDLCYDEQININQLANLSQIQNSTLYKYVNNVSLPTAKNAIKIADYFNCSLDYLMGLEEKTDKTNLKAKANTKLFYERYDNLLKRKNKTHYSLKSELNISNSNLRKWKNGTIPYMDTLAKLATYFDVSIDYLVGRCDEK